MEVQSHLAMLMSKPEKQAQQRIFQEHPDDQLLRVLPNHASFVKQRLYLDMKIQKIAQEMLGTKLLKKPSKVDMAYVKENTKAKHSELLCT